MYIFTICLPCYLVCFVKIGTAISLAYYSNPSLVDGIHIGIQYTSVQEWNDLHCSGKTIPPWLKRCDLGKELDLVFSKYNQNQNCRESRV